MSTATFNQSRSKGIDIRAWDVTLVAGDTGPDAFAHGLPYTPSFVALQPESSIGSAYPGVAIAVTSTTVTITKLSAANTGGTYILYVGRPPNPQNER